MKLPKAGERWMVIPCNVHSNVPGSYLWTAAMEGFNPEIQSIIRIGCGCTWPEVDGGTRATAQVANTVDVGE